MDEELALLWFEMSTARQPLSWTHDWARSRDIPAGCTSQQPEAAHATMHMHHGVTLGSKSHLYYNATSRNRSCKATPSPVLFTTRFLPRVSRSLVLSRVTLMLLSCIPKCANCISNRWDSTMA